MSSGRKNSRQKTKRFRWSFWRWVVQLTVVIFFLLLPVSNRMEQGTVFGTLTSLQIGWIDLVDPAAGFSTMLASLEVSRTLLLGMLLPVMAALLLGPVFCSWICPWGLISEIIDKLRSRWRGRPTRRWKYLSQMRWTVLAVFMMLSAGLGTPLAATLAAPRLITLLPIEAFFLGGVTSGTLTLLGVLLAMEIFLPRRIWCRAICPVGSTFVLLRTPWTLRISWREPTCEPEILGANCARVCSWNLDPRRMSGYEGCTNCGTCVDGCPSNRRSLHYVQGKLADRSDGRTLPVFKGRR